MSKQSPLRQCTGCRQMMAKGSLIRVVRTPSGEIVIDRTGKTNGRGAYVCRNPECLKMAIKNRGLERTLHSKIPEDIISELDTREESDGKGESH